jgi:hypothetical protein
MTACETSDKLQFVDVRLMRRQTVKFVGLKLGHVDISSWACPY